MVKEPTPSLLTSLNLTWTFVGPQVKINSNLLVVHGKKTRTTSPRTISVVYREYMNLHLLPSIGDCRVVPT